MFIRLAVQTILLGSAIGAGAGSAAGSDTQVQFNSGGSFGASSSLTFDGSTLKVAPTTDDTTDVFSVENAGTNPGKAGFKLGDRNPVGNVSGSAADLYIQASSSLSALYLHRNSTPNDTDWFSASLNPSNTKDAANGAEFDALGTAGVITISEDTTLRVKGTIATTSRIVVNPGIAFTITGAEWAQAAIVYSGTGTFLTTDGALRIQISGLNGLVSTSTGTLYDLKNIVIGYFITQSSVSGWDNPGVIEGANNCVFRQLGIFNSGATTTFKDCGSVIVTAAFVNAVTTSAPILTISGNLRDPIVRIESTNATLNTDESLLKMSPELGVDTRVIASGNGLSGPNKNFFAPSSGSVQPIETVTDDPESGTLSAFADNGSGGTSVTPVGGIADLSDDQTVTIDSTTSYNGAFLMFNVSGSTFDIPVPFVADDATGNFDAASINVVITAHGRSNGDFVELRESNSYNGFFQLFEVTTNAFNISAVFVSNQTGLVRTAASFNQTDSRVLTVLNPDIDDSSYLSAFSISENAVETVIADADTFQNVDLTGKTGAITAFADAGGGVTTATSAAHGLLPNEPIQLLDNANGYSGTFRPTNVTTNTFDIPVAFTSTGTGNFKSSVLADEDVQRFRVSDEVTGEVTYVGEEPFDGFVNATIGSFKSGAEVNYHYILCVNNLLAIRNPYVTVGIKTTLTNVTLVTPVRLVKGDVMNVQIAGVGSSANCTVKNITFLAQRK